MARNVREPTANLEQANATLRRENARLRRDLAAASRRETEVLEQQADTSEILRIISTSPANLQRVLDAVARSAALLCDTYDALILQVYGDVLHAIAHHGPLG